jgi:mannosyltransferase
VGLSLLPLVYVSAGQSQRQLGWLGRPSPAMWLQFGAIALVGALLARFVIRPSADGHGTPGGPVASLALPLLVAPAGLLMTVSLIKPWYVERYVLYSMVGLALLAGTALDRALALVRRRSPVTRIVLSCLSAGVALAVLVPWSLLVRSPESRKDDVVAVARAVERTVRPGDGFLFMPARRREWLLSYPHVYDMGTDLALAETPVRSRTLEGTELPADTVRRHILSTDRIVTLNDPPGQPLDPFPQEAVKRDTLRAHFRVCDRIPVRGAQIVVWIRDGSALSCPAFRGK